MIITPPAIHSQRHIGRCIIKRVCGAGGSNWNTYTLKHLAWLLNKDPPERQPRQWGLNCLITRRNNSRLIGCCCCKAKQPQFIARARKTAPDTYAARCTCSLFASWMEAPDRHRPTDRPPSTTRFKLQRSLVPIVWFGLAQTLSELGDYVFRASAALLLIARLMGLYFSRSFIEPNHFTAFHTAPTQHARCLLGTLLRNTTLSLSECMNTF